MRDPDPACVMLDANWRFDFDDNVSHAGRPMIAPAADGCKCRVPGETRGRYLGTNSSVASRRAGLRNPRTNVSAPGVALFRAYAASTARRSARRRTRTARTGTSRAPTWMAPRGSSRNVRYHPPAFLDHERTNTRPSSTTTQMPMNRWSDLLPARTPRILLASTTATSVRGRRRDFLRVRRAGGGKSSPSWLPVRGNLTLAIHLRSWRARYSATAASNGAVATQGVDRLDHDEHQERPLKASHRRGRCFFDTERMMSRPRPVVGRGVFDRAMASATSASTSGRASCPADSRRMKRV